MKKLLFIALLFATSSAFGANETVPNDRIITDIQVYADLAVITFTPAFQNNQNCSSPSTSSIQLSLSDDPNKLIFSTLLAAAASKSQVGFGIGGCAGQYPRVYRVDPKY